LSYLRLSRFFNYVNEANLTEEKGTYAKMIALFDNYIPETGVLETCGTICRDEEGAFLDAIQKTAPIQILHAFLYSKCIQVFVINKKSISACII